MVRPLRTIALLAVLAVLAGCLAPASPTATPTQSTDCPPALIVEQASDEQVDRIDSRLAYANLSAERQAEFDRAAAAGSAELSAVPETWAGPRIVTRDGEQYYAVVELC